MIVEFLSKIKNRHTFMIRESINIRERLKSE